MLSFKRLFFAVLSFYQKTENNLNTPQLRTSEIYQGTSVSSIHRCDTMQSSKKNEIHVYVLIWQLICFLFNKNLLSTYYTGSIILGEEETTLDKIKFLSHQISTINK